jgi:hypothetical protein
VGLPAGFAVDEAPEAMKLDAPFGTLEASSPADEEGKLVVKRKLELKHFEVAAADYAAGVFGHRQLAPCGGGGAAEEVGSGMCVNWAV